MPTIPTPARDVGPDLAMAVIAASSAPMLLLDGQLTVLAASLSFCTAFHVDPASIPARRIGDLGHGAWTVPQLASLLAATLTGDASIHAYELDLAGQVGGTRRLVVNAHKLEYGDPDNVRLPLSVSDVTEARLAEKLKDDLIREKEMLLQELQHRVANSLQIIASVLLQSARRVASDETRNHLYDAHQRVMSIASVQKQLALSRSGDVELRGYFTGLCRSIGASMIRDHNQLSLVVTSDEATTTADASISLGLIVTELVINALKHAFPGNRAGTITVGYKTQGSGWTLSVADDGVGIAKEPGSAVSGLGTSIVLALARQLQARVAVADATPGTLVSVIHESGRAKPEASLPVVAAV